MFKAARLYRGAWHCKQSTCVADTVATREKPRCASRTRRLSGPLHPELMVRPQPHICLLPPTESSRLVLLTGHGSQGPPAPQLLRPTPFL